MLRLMAQKTGVSEDCPLDRRAADVGNEKPGLPGLALHRVSGERKIKNRNALNAESAVIDGGIPAHFHDDLVRVELPLGTRQLAGGDGSVVDDVVVRDRSSPPLRR